VLRRCSINFIVSVNFNITEVPKLWGAHPEGCCWSCPGWGCRLYEGRIYFEPNMGVRLYIYIYIYMCVCVCVCMYVLIGSLLG
jgi:hypothetical protein